MNRLPRACENRTEKCSVIVAKTRPGARRSVAGPLLALVVWAAAGMSVARAEAAVDCDGGGSRTAAEQPTAILPVWAFLDGDTPVASARVRVYAIGQGKNGKPGRPRLLRPLGTGAEQRTYDSGVALLAFPSLPHTFIVTVSGGQAEGQTLRGSLSALVRGYRSGTVVQVTPVTTLVERWEHAEPGLNRARARVTVHRALGIPRWADADDLRATDQWFDGDTFLEREHGRLDRAFRALLGDIRSGASMRFRPADSDTDGSAQEVQGACADPQGCTGWWDSLDVAEIIKSGFTDLGLSVLFKGGEAGGKWLLGQLLDVWGLTDLQKWLLPEGSEELMQQMLKSIGLRMTQLQGTIENVHRAITETQYSLLVQGTNTQLAAIDRITRDLDTLAHTPKEHPTRVCFARTIAKDIESKLLTAPDELHRALDNPTPTANDILKAASQVYGTRRFFTAQSSADVQAIYEYFALYQFRLAVLLANYWNTKPGTYDPQLYVRPAIDRIKANIESQKTDRLKPPLPADKFIDTRTMKMWDRQPQWTNGWAFKPYYSCNPPYTTCGYVNKTFDFGTEEDFRDLIDGFTGDSPLAWLQKEAGLVVYIPEPGSGLPDRDRGLMWLGPSPDQDHWAGERIFRANLVFPERPGPYVLTNVLRDRNPQNYAAHAMRVQPVVSGTYWWPSGGK